MPVVSRMVGTDNIFDEAITTEKIAAGAIIAEKIAALAIIAEKIAASAITTEKLAALAITAEKIAAETITLSKLASEAIPPKTYYQTTEPVSGMKEGDYWIDTDDNNKIYNYQSGAWVAVGAAGGVTTFRQASVPTALSAGDLWIDTDDDKLYRATNAGDDEIKAGEWELINAATATGWAHGSDVTKIDGGKIYTETIVADAIAALTIIAEKIATGAIIAEKIGVGAVIAEKIGAGAVIAEKIAVSTLSAIVANLGEVTAGIITGLIIRTALSGARIYMDADNLIAYDNAENEIFKIILTGDDVGDIIIGDYDNAKGMKWDKSADTFYIRGNLSAGDITTGMLSGIAIIVENRTDDTGCTQTGRIWFRTDV